MGKMILTYVYRNERKKVKREEDVVVGKKERVARCLLIVIPLPLRKFLSIQNRCDSMLLITDMPATPTGTGHAEL